MARDSITLTLPNNPSNAAFAKALQELGACPRKDAPSEALWAKRSLATACCQLLQQLNADGRDVEPELLATAAKTREEAERAC